DELLGFVAGGRSGPSRGRRALRGRRGRSAALERHQHVQGIEPEEITDGNNSNEAHAAELHSSAESAARRSSALAVVNVVAAPHVTPAHRDPPSRGSLLLREARRIHPRSSRMRGSSPGAPRAVSLVDVILAVYWTLAQPSEPQNSMRAPNSTTWFGGMLKKSVAELALRAMKLKRRFRHRI